MVLVFDSEYGSQPVFEHGGTVPVDSAAGKEILSHLGAGVADPFGKLHGGYALYTLRLHGANVAVIRRKAAGDGVRNRFAGAVFLSHFYLLPPKFRRPTAAGAKLTLLL